MTAELQMTVEELLAVFIAREMRDFETCACGAQCLIRQPQTGETLEVRREKIQRRHLE